ncbi:S1 RNA-binding domain-containing protein [Parapedobacter deserti]|uniref:S1 RNA-binding domain-containing protein n=1 Tax=Parapedobacter deserti TaxID=1912957 RepID=A0ABV7JRE8_9SPHI
MAEIGRYNILRVAGKNSDGLSLSDGVDEILLPSAEVPPQTEVNDTISAFVFLNKAGQLLATTKQAFAEVGDFAFLTVVDAGEDGAFLDLGISKDVYVPVKEQRKPMRPGEKHVVYLYLDREHKRMLASSRLHKFIEEDNFDFEAGDEVELLISEKTDLGFNAIINNRHIGLLYRNELFTDIAIGDIRKGWVKGIRVEGKIDLSLRPQGFGHVLDTKDVIMRALKEAGGTISLGDKSTPEEIQARFQISKSAFKKAIGGLYKERLITLGDHEIKLLTDQRAD